MKAVVWIVVLFAAAVGIVLPSGVYTGNVYIVVGQVMMRVNLHAFILGLVLFVVTLYFLIKFIVGLMNIPARMQRFGTARKGRQAAVALNSAGLAFFEGRFEKAEQEAAKVLENKEAGDNRNLALMLGAHAADQMENFELRDHYLKDIEKLPNKQQLSRYLLLAESALGRELIITAIHQGKPDSTYFKEARFGGALDLTYNITPTIGIVGTYRLNLQHCPYCTYKKRLSFT